MTPNTWRSWKRPAASVAAGTPADGRWRERSWSYRRKPVTPKERATQLLERAGWFAANRELLEATIAAAEREARAETWDKAAEVVNRTTLYPSEQATRLAEQFRDYATCLRAGTAEPSPAASPPPKAWHVREADPERKRWYIQTGTEAVMIREDSSTGPVRFTGTAETALTHLAFMIDECDRLRGILAAADPPPAQHHHPHELSRIEAECARLVERIEEWPNTLREIVPDVQALARLAAATVHHPDIAVIEAGAKQIAWRSLLTDVADLALLVARLAAVVRVGTVVG